MFSVSVVPSSPNLLLRLNAGSGAAEVARERAKESAEACALIVIVADDSMFWRAGTSLAALTTAVFNNVPAKAGAGAAARLVTPGMWTRKAPPGRKMEAG